MRRIYILWILAVSLIVYLTFNYSSIDAIFYGISDSKEMEISEDRSVTIDSIHVVSGELVKKGQVLVSLSSKQLEMEIAQKVNRIQELKVQKIAGKNDINSRVIQLRQEKMIKLNEIDQNIRTLQDQYDRNVNFALGLKSLNIKTETNEKSPIYKQIGNLKEQRSYTIKSYNLKISQLKNAVKRGEDPNETLIQNIEEELEELVKQKSSLKIYSKIDGVIGSVNYKAQSTVPPYSTMVTLSKKAPSYVKGFVHEKVYNIVKVGDKVTVHSTAQNYSVDGVIVGVGSRIVEFPERLRKRVDMRIWGREVVIKIPEKNSLLLGEKVSVSVTSKKGK